MLIDAIVNKKKGSNAIPTVDQHIKSFWIIQNTFRSISRVHIVN